jgi:nucleoside-diphosphate-sugar epimerase
MKTKNILITGGCGFIGSNLVLHLAKKYAKDIEYFGYEFSE